MTEMKVPLILPSSVTVSIAELFIQVEKNGKKIYLWCVQSKSSNLAKSRTVILMISVCTFMHPNVTGQFKSESDIGECVFSSVVKSIDHFSGPIMSVKIIIVVYNIDTIPTRILILCILLFSIVIIGRAIVCLRFNNRMNTPY